MQPIERMDENSTKCEIVCPFCKSPWSDKNIHLYDLDAGDHCDSGRYYSENCTVSIICHSCKREMYRKEGYAID